MGVVTSGLRRVASTLSRINAFLPKQTLLYSDRFANTHEVNPLVSHNWQQEAGLLIGVSSFNHVLSVRATPKRRELGNVLVPCAVNTQRVPHTVNEPGEPGSTPPNWRGNCCAQH
jgi:hypothetical protein